MGPGSLQGSGGEGWSQRPPEVGLPSHRPGPGSPRGRDSETAGQASPRPPGLQRPRPCSGTGVSPGSRSALAGREGCPGVVDPCQPLVLGSAPTAELGRPQRPANPSSPGLQDAGVGGHGMAGSWGSERDTRNEKLPLPAPAPARPAPPPAQPATKVQATGPAPRRPRTALGVGGPAQGHSTAIRGPFPSRSTPARAGRGIPASAAGRRGEAGRCPGHGARQTCSPRRRQRPERGTGRTRWMLLGSVGFLLLGS